MIITIDETGKKFEAQDERIDQVFEEVKESALAIVESYGEDEKDVTAAVLALCIMANELKQKFENTFGYEEIVRVLNAKAI